MQKGNCRCFFCSRLVQEIVQGRVVQPFVPQLVQNMESIAIDCRLLPLTNILNLLSVSSMSSMPFLYSVSALTCFVCVFPSDHQFQYSSWTTNKICADSGRIAPDTRRQHLGLGWRCLDNSDNALHILHCCYVRSQAFQLSFSRAAHSFDRDQFVFF